MLTFLIFSVLLVEYSVTSVVEYVDPICGFVAATNIESILSEWSCYPNGTTVSIPCMSPQWEGIACDGSSEFSNITSILLEDTLSSVLTGTLPSSLGSLSALTFLAVYETEVFGSIPASYGCLTKIVTLVLFGNQLTGPLPSGIANMPFLYYMDIMANFLSGPLPSNLGSMSALVELIVNQNQFSGLIPSSVGCLSVLISLSLTDNCISGRLPPSLGSLSHTLQLFATSNRLTGHIPTELCIMANLEAISLGENQLSGRIPSCVDQLSSLQSLFIDSNELTGPLPPKLFNMSVLRDLNLRQNRLTGSLPAASGYAGQLVNLNINGNLLTGSLPASFGSVTSFQVLYLTDNLFTGSIPPAWGNLTNLAYMFLDDNMLTGVVPLGVQALRELYFVTFSYNFLSGSIPSGFTSSDLQYLFMENNLFTGSLPSNVDSFTNLHYLDLHGNLLSGPLGFTQLPNLLYLDMSKNLFVGTIPSDMSWTIGSFNVSDNPLSGYIPTQLGASSSLNSLNVSGTPIDGTIPVEFCATIRGISIDVTGTNIECYSGCLTSSAVVIIGASSQCHNGDITLRFLVLCGFCCVVLVLFTLVYRWNTRNARSRSSAARKESRADTDKVDAPSHASLKTGGAKNHKLLVGVVTITFFKLLLAIVISMGLNNWWSYGDHDNSDAVVESCSNPAVGNCYSFCQDVTVVGVNITTDDYTVDDGTADSYPTVNSATHYTEDTYCIAELRGGCAYGYWLVFRLVPIMLHTVGFLMQGLTWWFYSEFTPQQKQFDFYIEYLFPELLDVIHVADGGKLDYRAMFRDLTRNPAFSVFSFLEMLTVVYVWGELWVPSVYCGSVRPLSLYHYPILMTLLELTKFNLYVVSSLAQEGCFGLAVWSLFNFEMFVAHFWISSVLAGIFAGTSVVNLCEFLLWRISQIYFCCTGTSSKAWPNIINMVDEPSNTVQNADTSTGIRSMNPLVLVAELPTCCGDLEGGGKDNGAIELRVSIHE